ncbi:MAG: DUF2185 domain-containing protein [Oscillospiraceae bacterium]|nr:DUF2185 domain-containing protein [Oscillospiraceae bacterium]
MSDYIKIEVKELLDWYGKGPDGCIASDKITKEGWKVGYMFREEPTPGFPDSGWCVLAGNEDDDYMNNADNHHPFALNTICNYDPDIIPYLDSPVGTAYIRVSSDKFEIDDRSKEIFLQKQNR